VSLCVVRKGWGVSERWHGDRRTCLWANPCWPTAVSPQTGRQQSWNRRQTRKVRPPRPCGTAFGDGRFAATIACRGFINFFSAFSAAWRYKIYYISPPSIVRHSRHSHNYRRQWLRSRWRHVAVRFTITTILSYATTATVWRRRRR